MLLQILTLAGYIIAEGVPLLAHHLVLGYHLACGVAKRLRHIVHTLFAGLGCFLRLLIGFGGVFSGGGVADYQADNGQYRGS